MKKMNWFKHLIKKISLPSVHNRLEWGAPGRVTQKKILTRDGVEYPVQGAQYHGMRPDGVYVPIVIVDPRGEPGDADAAISA